MFTEEEILHYLMPVEGVIETHVVEGKGEAVPLVTHSEAGCNLQSLRACGSDRCATSTGVLRSQTIMPGRFLAAC